LFTIAMATLKACAKEAFCVPPSVDHLMCCKWDLDFTSMNIIIDSHEPTTQECSSDKCLGMHICHHWNLFSMWRIGNLF
jgi:hypothetical protein